MSPNAEHRQLPRVARWAATVVLVLMGLISLAWETGAAWFDGPLGKANAVLVVVLVLVHAWFIWRVRPLHRLVAAWIIMLAVVFGIWSAQKPRHDRDWQPDVARMARAEINGDKVTLHNVRNFDYTSPSLYVEHWETRTVDLSKLNGLDIAICYWGSPWMAHPILSFQFMDAPPVCFSIETRKEKGESYSALGGLYRQFELIYIVADEADVLRHRTNIRDGEDVYLYRTTANAKQARERFLEYVGALNALHKGAQWYNAITTNCTTTIRAQRPKDKRLPWDWRFLVNGKGDEMLYEQGIFVTDGLSFESLKARSLINNKAKEATSQQDFSAKVRK